ncbi:MAG: hypothetical protein KTR31_13035 [Myxococcales bacterium]|nr:hypothetical protein [Myxococcales bacterium]
MLSFITATILGCGTSADVAVTHAPPVGYDPLARALAEAGEAVKRQGNREAAIPAMCYTRTAGTSNPCWVCHTRGTPPVPWDDRSLQHEYAFSDVALTNAWSNLFEDRTARIAAISDAEILDYIRVDNYTPLKEALEDRDDFAGYRPDLDLSQGFDDEGFAKDGSGWRALRYKPFLGTFWPTNGNTDDVFVRLPEAFRGSRELYKINLALVEAAVALNPRDVHWETAVREVEPISERVAGVDLDGDGALEDRVTSIRGLPSHFVGEAAPIAVEPFVYPQDIEFLHSVRYVDPDAPDLLSARMKELRYSRNRLRLEKDRRYLLVEKETEDREQGLLPVYAGSALSGLRGIHAWILQGYIEDEDGWLRLQTHEEHRFCMGCHGAIGVSVDGTFTMPRKVPGAEGWRPQDLRGIPDVPQAGHAEPEYLTYFLRNRGADELRENTEMLERFFTEVDGLQVVVQADVRQAAPGGSADLAWLLTPSRRRALDLAKAYRTIVMDQDFHHGRDANLAVASNVHRTIHNGATENDATGLTFEDGALALSWPAPSRSDSLGPSPSAADLSESE